MTRASEAAARAFWPLGNTQLEKRLGLIKAPTLILWGDKDAVLPPSYAEEVRHRHQRRDPGRNRRRMPAISPISTSPTPSRRPSWRISADLPRHAGRLGGCFAGSDRYCPAR